MARNGRDLFERSSLSRVPTAAEVLSGKAKWNEATQSWEFKGKTSTAPKARAQKPKEEPEKPKGGMTPDEIEKVVSRFSDRDLEIMGKVESVRQQLRDLLSNKPLPKDSDDWAKGGQRELNQSGTPKSQEQLIAYKFARDNGLLEGGEKDVVAQARQFVEAIGERATEREYQMLIDREGNRIYAIKGDKGAVGIGTPSDPLGRPLSGFKDRDGRPDLRVVTAGSTMHHNHPRAEDPNGLGLSFSGGDLGNTIRLARGAITATAKEGIYVGRNTKWEEHAKIPTESAVFRGRSFAAEIDRATVKVQNAFYAEARAGRYPRTSEAFYRYVAPRMHAANIILARKHGIEIDFVPNKGYEWIADEAQQLVAAASGT